jgi:eukaryotic-like serine/threonine-protein kinase
MQTFQRRTPGEVYLGRYEAVQMLGEGGMGRVYLGRQLDVDRQVVIKVMHDEIAADPRFRQRFERELRLMAGFKHTHAVALYDASVGDAGKPCIVMEYVAGITLDDVLQKDGFLPVERVGRLLGQLCWVLQSAHQAGITHRDLSCANIMVAHPGTPAELVKVMDFGLARMGAGPYIALEKLTGSGDSIGGGTPDYMCPEQIRGDEVDHRGDLYSLGVVLFKLLTGRLPFGELSETADILLAHADKVPPSFAEVCPEVGISPAIEAVVQSCLAKYPFERPQSARALADRFAEALGHALIEWPDAESSLPCPAVPPDNRQKVAPDAVVDHLEAWMPERIAVVKLRGFVDDMGGEVIESLPGLIRVRLRIPGTEVEASPRSFWSFLGFGHPAPVPCHLLMELHMEKKQADHNLLHVTVVMQPEKGSNPPGDDSWRAFSAQLGRDLGAYLIGRR